MAGLSVVGPNVDAAIGFKLAGGQKRLGAPNSGTTDNGG